MKDQIFIQRTLNFPIDDVWGAIATKEGISSWFMPTADFEPTVGSTFHMITKPQGKFDGKVICQIKDIQPPNQMTYTWESNALPETIVTWKLEALSENETKLSLYHYGFRGFSGWFVQQILNIGWKKKIKKSIPKYLRK